MKLFNQHEIPSEIYWTINELCGAQYDSGETGGGNQAYVDKARLMRELLEQKIAAELRAANDLLAAVDHALQWHKESTGNEPSASVFERSMANLRAARELHASHPAKAGR